MKQETTWYAVTIALLLFFQSCSPGIEKQQCLKTLDSIGGALSTVISASRVTDTVLLQKALTKFNHYQSFIKRNLRDTISKPDANCLQQFYRSGKNLESFAHNRLAVRSRAALAESQLMRLGEDLKYNRRDLETQKKYLAEEKLQIELLLSLSRQEGNLFSASLEEFKLSLRCTEEIIRQKNKGQLPEVIEEKESL